LTNVINDVSIHRCDCTVRHCQSKQQNTLTSFSDNHLIKQFIHPSLSV